MDFISKLNWLMNRDGLNRSSLAQKSNIPYTTIVGLFERGADNARLSTLDKLCKCFNVPLDYLAYDEYEKPEDFTPNGNTITVYCETKEEQELLNIFRLLNLKGQDVLLQTAKGLSHDVDLQKEDGNIATA